jgi:futalosine hydrolase
LTLRLIVAATRAELEPLLGRLEGSEEFALPYGKAVRGCRLGVPLVAAWLGVGKVNTAAGLALAVRTLDPKAVVQLGIGGAFPGAPVEVGGAAVAAAEVHLDCGVEISAAEAGPRFEDMEALGFPLLAGPVPVFNRIPLAGRLPETLSAQRWPLLSFGTAETVTGRPERAHWLARRFGVAVESMEGAAAAQVCLALGVPFGEIRGVSNLVGERDWERWRIPAALAAAHEVLEEWLANGAPVPHA